jgi:hypothetical protein
MAFIFGPMALAAASIFQPILLACARPIPLHLSIRDLCKPFRPCVTGEAINGGFGFVKPEGNLPALFGSPMLEFGVSGTLAIVHRRASLYGNDLLSDLVGGPVLATFIDTSERTWAAVPAAQAQLVSRPAVQIRVIGGVEWDSRMRGIVSPSFTPDQFFTFSGTSASIGFSGRPAISRAAALPTPSIAEALTAALLSRSSRSRRAGRAPDCPRAA